MEKGNSMDTLQQAHHIKEAAPDTESDQQFGQTVLRSIAFAEALQGFVDPDNPVYDQN
jgi:hypothetical protein